MVAYLSIMQEGNKMKNTLMSFTCVLSFLLLISTSTVVCFPGSTWSFETLEYNLYMLLPIVITSVIGKLWETVFGSLFGIVVFYILLISSCSGVGSSDPLIFVAIFIAVPIASLLGIVVGNLLSRKPREK